ncbi:MAG: hypothetical protein QM817_28230 [Archangium sp.]
MRRLLQLIAVVLGLLLALEVVCRFRREGLAAVAHRVRFKLALLHARGAVDFVVLGSSRTNDGVKPPLLGLGDGFSAATPSTSLQTLQFFADGLGPQKRVLVEVSRPTFSDFPMDAIDATPPGSYEGDPIGAWLQSHSALLQLRRAFALENLPRVFALFFPSRFDGSEWLRTRFLIEMFREVEAGTAPPGVSDDAAWVPLSHDLNTPTTLDADGERVVNGFVNLVTTLRANGAQVVLTAPPIGSGWKGDECTEPMNAVRREVARRTAAPFLDFTCAQVDDAWFVEGQHLSALGRAKYSRVLGEAVRALP